jgi:hypothetical protein
MAESTNIPAPDGHTPDGAGVAEQVVAGLLEYAHLMPPDALVDALSERAAPLGVRRAEVYLADVQQRYLRPLPSQRQGGADGPPAALSIDSTLAGRAFQMITMHHAEAGGGLFRLWVPVVDGTVRLGVLELIVTEIDELMLRRCRMLASLAGLMIISKNAYSDTYAQIRRSREMALQAEMEWAFMAPPTFATERVMVAAALEPAYEVGGDAFDYSLLGDRLSVSIFDAAGHDLTAGLIASVAMASCRNTRRSGGDLLESATRVDHAIADQFDRSRFATALLCELNIATGHLTWIVCGHPAPLLIRDSQVVKELLREPHPPLGIAYEGAPPQIHHEQLQPGDRLLLYTDGVVEGRGPDGRQFGLQRLSDFVIRHSARGLSAPETLRRLNRAIVDYQRSRLTDDATTLLLEWMPADLAQQVTAQPGEDNDPISSQPHSSPG